MIEFHKVTVRNIDDAHRFAKVLIRRSGMRTENTDAQSVLAEVILHLERKGDLSEDSFQRVFTLSGMPDTEKLLKTLSQAKQGEDSVFLDHLFPFDPRETFTSIHPGSLRARNAVSGVMAIGHGLLDRVRDLEALDWANSLAV